MDGVLPKTLERKDLDIKCPRKIRNRIADKIIDEWDLVGRELDVSDKKLKSIREDCALTLPERKAVAVLDAWADEHGSGATCLKLAEALYCRTKTRVIEILCDEVTQMKRKTTMSGAGAAVPPQPSDKQQQEQGGIKVDAHNIMIIRAICGTLAGKLDIWFGSGMLRGSLNTWSDSQTKVRTQERGVVS